MVHFVTAPVRASNAHLDLESQHETLHTSSTHIYETFEHLKVFHMHVLRNLQLWLILACKTGHFVSVEHEAMLNLITQAVGGIFQRN